MSDIMFLIISWLYINWYIILVEFLLFICAIWVLVNIYRTKNNKWDLAIVCYWILLVFSILLYLWDITDQNEDPSGDCAKYRIMCTGSEILFSCLNLFFLGFTIYHYCALRKLGGIQERPEGFHREL